jgi:hypothetical protein
MTPDTTTRLPLDVLSPALSPAEIVTAPAKPARPRRPVGTLVTVVVLVGMAFRVGVYLRNPSFWIDEAMLAVNVVHRSPAQLLEPLDLNQGAPIGFLLLSKAALVLLGNSEYALRAVPLAAALAGFAMFVALAYRLLPLVAARLAVVLFAFSPYLVGYAAEFKQYELDAAIAVGLVLLGRPVWEGTAARRDRVLLAAAGAVAVWFSHPAVFVLGGVGSAMLLDAVVKKDRTLGLRNAAVVAAWVVSFAACYLFFLRRLGTNAYLIDYWAGTFLPLPPVRPGDLAWLVNHFFLLFDKPGGFDGETGTGGFAAVCCLIGAVAMARSNWRLLVALGMPFAFALAASGLRKYPFAGRLMLFAVPLMIVLVAHGAVTIADRLRDLGSFAWWAVVVAVCLGSFDECNTLRKRPLHAEDAREAVAELAAGWRPGDRVYVYYGAVPAFRHYAPPIPAAAVTFGGEHRGDDQWAYRDELSALRGHPRVWVLFAHRQRHEEAAVRAYLDAFGTGDVVSRRSDAVLLRYDLSNR